MSQVRIARPVRDLAHSKELYCRGLGLKVIGGFTDHVGFDGVMLGEPGGALHFEFTYCRTHPVAPTPTPEDLVVFYLANEEEWRVACERMTAAGFATVVALNPYWDTRGRTFQDPDGYRIVLWPAPWR